MLHSISVSILALAASSTLGLWNGMSEASILFALTIGVALIGLPHGGLDHRVGKSLFSNFVHSDIQSKIGFYLSYLTIAAAVVVGWYLIPATTIVIFFAMSAWHFGLEEEEFRVGLRWFDHLGIAARGGMVIWCTSAFRSQEVLSLIETIAPAQGFPSETIVFALGVATPVLVCLLSFDLYRYFKRSTPMAFSLQLVRLSLFAVTFAVCPVLLSFAIYFCGWHSIRGLVHLRNDFHGSNVDFARALLPMSLLSIGLIACAVIFYQNQLTLSDAVIRSLFIGLSAVAVPHLTLHIFADSLEVQNPKRKTKPEAIACPS